MDFPHISSIALFYLFFFRKSDSGPWRPLASKNCRVTWILRTSPGLPCHNINWNQHIVLILSDNFKLPYFNINNINVLIFNDLEQVITDFVKSLGITMNGASDPDKPLFIWISWLPLKKKLRYEVVCSILLTSVVRITNRFKVTHSSGGATIVSNEKCI